MIGIIRPPLAARHVVCVTRLYSSSSLSTVPLAYDHHAPAKSSPTALDARTSPIIIMHGLFGSKKNNRSISK